jgi:hypothetical protein
VPCREFRGLGLRFGPRIGEMAGLVMAWIVSIWCLLLALAVPAGAGLVLRPVVPVAGASGAAAVEIVRGSVRRQLKLVVDDN